MEAIREIKTEKYTVRVHPGKRTEAERKEALTNAAKEFYRAIQAERHELPELRRTDYREAV